MSTHTEDDEGSSSMVLKFPVQGHVDFNGKLWDDGAYSDIKEILIAQDNQGVSSIQIQYIDENGKSKWPVEHVLTNLPTVTKVELDYPNEFLTSIHGFYTDKSSFDFRINSLTFESNKKLWGPYGKEKGIKFSFLITGAKIVGFHGYTNRELMAIGIYATPITKNKLLRRPQVMRPQLDEPFSLGLYGGDHGKYWSEKFASIKRFVIHYEDDFIISIQMDYVDENGKFVSSEKHGGNGGISREIVLEDDEYLDTIAGYYDNPSDSKSTTNVIQSLAVITNKKNELVGVQKGRMFKFPRDGRLKVVGIHGRSDMYLNAIGINAARI